MGDEPKGGRGRLMCFEAVYTAEGYDNGSTASVVCAKGAG